MKKRAMEGETGKKRQPESLEWKKKGCTVPTNLNQVNRRPDCSSETEPCFAAKQTRKHVLT